MLECDWLDHLMHCQWVWVPEFNPCPVQKTLFHTLLTPNFSCSPCPVEKTLLHTFQLLFLPALPFSAGQSTPCWEDTTSYPPTPISSFPPFSCNVPWTLGWGGWGGKLIDMSQHSEHLICIGFFPSQKEASVTKVESSTNLGINKY